MAFNNNKSGSVDINGGEAFSIARANAALLQIESKIECNETKQMIIYSNNHNILTIIQYYVIVAWPRQMHRKRPPHRAMEAFQIVTQSIGYGIRRHFVAHQPILGVHAH